MLEITLFSLISIHALREEGDSTSIAATTRLGDFYPRPPRGGRPSTPPPWSSVAHFYPRPPRGGRPILRSAVLAAKGISIHALREEGDRVWHIS